MTTTSPRKTKRFVTGHDADGRAVFLSQGEPPQYHSNPILTELWASTGFPEITAQAEKEPNDRPLDIAPPTHGTIFRIVDFHPGHSATAPRTAEGKPAGFHRTETIDYGIVLEGEIHLVLDDEEAVMQTGDVVIQRGTGHAWVNRSSSLARVAFVLIDAKFSPELADRFADDQAMKHSAKALIE